MKNKLLAIFLVVACLVSTCSAENLREITQEIVQEVPEQIQEVLDLAYAELKETDGRELHMSNKYTKWRTDSNIGWCGAFVTWCMLECGVPQKDKNHIQKGEVVDGIVHVKEAGVGKLYTGYEKMNRITNIPQKGFVVVFGNGKQFHDIGITAYYHVGIVYDAVKLDEGKYRITTIEGAVSSPGDAERKRAGYTIRMYTRDYDMNARIYDNTTLVPEEERTEKESGLFSYDYTYGNEHLYIKTFLMPWIP